MANWAAVHSVGDSLITYLRNSYPDPLRTDLPCAFRLFSSGEMADMGEIDTTLSLYLYRLTVNEHLRNTKRGLPPNSEDIPLSLDLHYLMTVWTHSALEEHTILAWAMRQLYLNPVLTLSSLSPDGGWGQQDKIQLIPAELSTEDLMRIWDALKPSYRLSVSYIARVVRIDADTTPDQLRVVATQFVYQDKKVAS